MSNELNPLSPPAEFSDSRKGASTPFSKQIVTLSKQEHIQLKYDVNRWRGLAQQWKDKCYHLEQSQQEHETRKYLKLLEKHRRQSEELERTKARVLQLEKQVYGRKTEKKPVKKSEALEPASAAPKKKRGAQRGSKGHGRTPREKLPREVETLDVAPEDQVCDFCGAAYAPMSNTDNSEILEYFTKAYFREIRRKKYAKTCNCRQTPAVVTAKPAPRVIAKGLLGVSVWVEILLSKYSYSRSTCNLLRQMRDQGMAISQGTVTDGLKKMVPLFEPLLDQLMQRQMEDSVFHCDETGWKVYEKMEGKIGNRWYLWVFESTSSVIYRMEPTRSGDVPIKHFSALSEKLKEVFVICDRYSGYKRLAKVNAAIILAFCWVHMRRDYLEAAVQYPQLEPWMFEWRERIGEIYHLNARRLEHFDESRPLAQQSESFMRQQQRLERSVEQMERTLKHELSAEQMHPAQLKVLSSLQNHWSGLMVFLKHPQVALDNNSGERKMRNPAMLRKNCRGSGSHWSASLAAQMFSIIQSVLLWDLNPHRWLYEYLSACAANGGQAPENLEAFIPWRMSEARRAEMSQPPAAVSQRSSLISKCEAAVSTQRGCLSTVSQPP